MASSRSNRRRPSIAVLYGLCDRFWLLRGRSPNDRTLDTVKMLKPLRRPPLSQSYPDVCQDWLYELNEGYEPDDFNHFSSFMVWWTCPAGPDHVYAQTIHQHVRAYRDDSKIRGCPFCKGLLPSVTNNLQALFPEVAREFDQARNKVAADLVVAKSAEQAWWKCKSNPRHRWRAQISSRTVLDSGCPHCNEESYEHTDLRNYPIALSEFDRLKNKGVDPHNLQLRLKIWWRCPKGKDHVWKSSFTRTKGSRCPFCRGIKPSSTNNLELHPDLLAEFHPTKNGKLKAQEVTLGGHRKIWWKCAAGPDHEWRKDVYSRLKGRGCPFCSNHSLSVTNSLAAKYPQIARLLHPTKNGTLSAAGVIANSCRKLWWKDQCGHEYQQIVRSKTLYGKGCYLCLADWRREHMSKINQRSKRG